MGIVIAFPGTKEATAPKQETIVKTTPAKVLRREEDDFNKLGHLIIGTLIGLTIAHDPIAFMSVIFGSLLPDIDSKKSTLGRYNPFTRFMKHRGHCHSLVGALVITLPFSLLGAYAYGAAFAGALGHIAGDKIYSWLPHSKKFRLKLW